MQEKIEKLWKEKAEKQEQIEKLTNEKAADKAIIETLKQKLQTLEMNQKQAIEANAIQSA